MELRKREINPVQGDIAFQFPAKKKKLGRQSQPLEERDYGPFLVGNSSLMSKDYLPYRGEILRHFNCRRESLPKNHSMKRIIACPLGKNFR